MVTDFNQNSIFEAALNLWEWDWNVIPIVQGTKHTPVKWGRYQQERADRAKVSRWFKANRRGLAAIMGPTSDNLACRDFDRMDAYEAWATNNPRLASELPTVETGRDGGGRHVYCRMQSIPQSLGECVHTYKDGSGEFRHTSCYNVLPPSTHESGRRYRWIIPPTHRIQKLNFDQTGFFHTNPPDVTERTETDRDNRVNGDNRGLQRTTEITDAISGRGGLEKQTPVFAETIQDAIQDAILKTLPKSQGTREKQVFQFARALRAIPEICDAALEDLEPYVREWHKLALPVIGTQPFEDTWIDFLRAYPRVKFPMGEEPMAQVFKRAVSVEVPPEAQKYESPQMQLLAALCREMQRAAGDKPFYLGCRTAGKFLDASHTHAARWLFLLEFDHIIETTEKGSPKTNKATRFRYLGKL